MVMCFNFFANIDFKGIGNKFSTIKFLVITLF